MKTLKSLVLASLLAVGLLLVAPVYSAVFVKIPDIMGESMSPGHEGEIDIVRWTWGALVKIDIRNNPTRPPKIGKSIGSMEMNLTKEVDSTSADLFLACANGKHYPIVEITMVKSTTNEDIYRLILTDVRITSYNVGGSGGEDRLTEEVTLNFEEVQATYLPQKADGSNGTPQELGWDVKAKPDA